MEVRKEIARRRGDKREIWRNRNGERWVKHAEVGLQEGTE